MSHHRLYSSLAIAYYRLQGAYLFIYFNYFTLFLYKNGHILTNCVRTKEKVAYVVSNFATRYTFEYTFCTCNFIPYLFSCGHPDPMSKNVDPPDSPPLQIAYNFTKHSYKPVSVRWSTYSSQIAWCHVEDIRCHIPGSSYLPKYPNAQ